MARTSYGGDIFSPIRSDLSLNDSSLKEGSSGRGSVSEDLVTISPVKSSKGINLTDRRRKNDRTLPLEEITLRRKNNKVGNKSTKRNEGTVLKSDSLISPCVKDENINSELPLKRSPRIARRSHKKDGEIGEKQTESKDLNSLSSNKLVSSQVSKKKKDSVRNFITYRGRESKKTERVGNNAKDCSANVLATQSEKLEEKENKAADSAENSYEIPAQDGLSNKIKRSIPEISVIPDSPVLSNEEALLLPMKEKIDEVDLKSSNKDDTESNSDCVNEVLPRGPAGIQIKMIEKLISDSVTDQFDVIRQQMYQQQICFLKVLNETRAEFEDRYSRDTENLHKIIEELLVENRHLRSAIIARQ